VRGVREAVWGGQGSAAKGHGRRLCKSMKGDKLRRAFGVRNDAHIGTRKARGDSQDGVGLMNRFSKTSRNSDSSKAC